MPAGRSTQNGTNRLISHLAAFERLTSEPRRSREAMLETVLGNSTAQLALAATGYAQRHRRRAY